MARGKRITGPVRDMSPCNGCKRPWKKPGCHDTCPDFAPWKQKGEDVRQAREEYLKSRYSSHKRI